jgi:hypothetical protein
MKSILISLFGLFTITATITHIWTTIIAFTEGGFFSGVLSFFLPFLSEVYWMISMFGDNNLYAYTALLHLLLAIPMTMINKN